MSPKGAGTRRNGPEAGLERRRDKGVGDDICIGYRGNKFRSRRKTKVKTNEGRTGEYGKVEGYDPKTGVGRETKLKFGQRVESGI